MGLRVEGCRVFKQSWRDWLTVFRSRWTRNGPKITPWTPGAFGLIAPITGIIEFPAFWDPPVAGRPRPCYPTSSSPKPHALFPSKFKPYIPTLDPFSHRGPRCLKRLKHAASVSELGFLAGVAMMLPVGSSS